MRELWRSRPRLHVFGHVHEGAGTEWLDFDRLQANYEDTMDSGGGIWDLARMILSYVQAWFSGRPLAEAATLLVNAAVVGGLRDEERRKPTKVVI